MEAVIGDRVVALFNVGGKFFALDGVCPHQGGPLGEGELSGYVVTCPWHAWRFRVSDGTWADNPRIKIPAFAVRVEGDDVQVELPEPKPRPTLSGDAP